MKFDNEKLLSLLKERNMKQYELAKSIQRARSTVSQYTTGKEEPGKDALISMSNVLEVPIEALLKPMEEAASE